jgi:hypothetical protein
MITSSLRNFFSGLALVSFLSVGAASAQSLVGVNAKLDRALDSSNATVGQSVTARLDGTVTAGGTKLPRGTELIGKVAEVKNEGSPVSVSLLFTSAKLKDGKDIPIKATVLAAFPQSGDYANGESAVGQPPVQVDASSAFDQPPGGLGHVALTSAVKNQNSGTFTSTKGDFRLEAGTYLQVGIAPVSSGSSMNAAE